MNNFFKHLKTTLKHKWYVFQACRKSGIFWRGIKHDLSKFSPIEFITSVKYYTGTSSPIDAEKKATGRSVAWAHHKGRNSHHWHYWVDWKGGNQYAMEMPIDDVKELICDWIGAGKAYNAVKWTNQEPLNYYHKMKHTFIFHPDTEKSVIELVNFMAQHGEIKFYKMLKSITK